MTDAIASFIDHMRAHDCGPADPGEIIADDKRRRYRLDGDKPKTRNGSYQLKVEGDGFAVGWVRSFKQGETHNWHSKSNRKASDEDRSEWKRKAAASKKARDAEIKALSEKAATKAKGIWARAERTGESEYLTAKGCDLNGARIWQGLIVLPMYSKAGVVGLQFIQGDGVKRFLTGSAKEGAYFPIASAGEPMSRVVICEGYATGCALRRATGLPIVVAFDSGNLKPVAKALRIKYPDTEFVFAGDNDQWTTKADGVTPYNPGLEGAAQAAVAIGGARVISPDVPTDDEARRTDWDDVARTDGDDVVRAAFEALPERYDDQEDMAGMERDDDFVDEVVRDDSALSVIRPLGFNRGSYSFFPHAVGQIVTMGATSMGRIQNLYQLAPRSFWEQHYSPDGKTPDSQICAFASAHLMDACHKEGIFQPENVRGVGAWIDNGKPIVNCGDAIWSDGKATHPAQFKGQHVYESGPRIVDSGFNPLGSTKAAKLRDICRMVTWKKPQFADLLAGWLVIAPVGSALGWRPHIFVTGRAESGKTTVMNEIVKPVLGPVSINNDGGSTEAGLRTDIGTSGRPLVIDEAEGENKKEAAAMESIVKLARLASSGGVIRNFNAAYQIRSAFCFSAITPRVEAVADKGRISLLELQRDERPDRAERFEDLLDVIHETLTPEFSKGLLARTIANMPTLLINIKTFSKAASEVFGNKRAGDQMGAMLAGAYLLTTTKEVSIEQARAWIGSQDWDWHTASYEESDAEKLITYIMTARVRYDHEGMSRESTVGDLVEKAASKMDPHKAAADKALRPYGMRIKDGMLCIANQAPQLRKLLSETPYIPWARTLGDYKGSSNLDNRAMHFMAGLTSKAVGIPVSVAVGGDVVDDAPDVTRNASRDDEEIPFE